MEPSEQQLIDATLNHIRVTFLNHADIIEAQKQLIISMGEALSDQDADAEVRDYLFNEAKKILKELFEKEE